MTIELVGKLFELRGRIDNIMLSCCLNVVATGFAIVGGSSIGVCGVASLNKLLSCLKLS